MSQIKYKDKTYGASPFAFFKDKAAAEAARQAGRIVPGQIVITLDDAIGQMMAASVGYDNSESGLEAENVQDAIGKIEDGYATPTFTSYDVADGSANAWTSVTTLASGETCKSIFTKISQMFKNIRYVHNALEALNSAINGKTNTRVKGNAESAYRTGDVNITPANIGLGNVENTKVQFDNISAVWFGYNPNTDSMSVTFTKNDGTQIARVWIKYNGQFRTLSSQQN